MKWPSDFPSKHDYPEQYERPILDTTPKQP
jgi:hypothetical protein